VTVDDDLAIRRLLAEYCRHVDDARFAAAAALFTTDGAFVMGDDQPTGRHELASWWEAQQPPHRRGRHISGEPIVDVDGDRATVSSDFLFVRWIRGVLTLELAGRYHDRCVRGDDGWRIERRVVELLEPLPPR